eukprot:CAMPEP_0168166654 /NCGR_PEP_ID=MMETSP0139_2-20121125/2143_1 /TAXON_ID=44445 /ORGANISM="Pseudo-nitzschia australis, Strain 10249 10 AB" /LENGTH=352 /DNA_ID=CAMNT_0008083867 /DNA_START=21 /DNA_END=1076 /DNA_ORIENTATION=+
MNALENTFLPYCRRRYGVVASIGAPTKRWDMVSTRRDFTSTRCRSDAFSSTVLTLANGHRARFRLRRRRAVPGRQWRRKTTATAAEKSMTCEESSALKTSGYGSTVGIVIVALATSTGIAAFLASARPGADETSNKNDIDNYNDTKALEYSNAIKERNNNYHDDHNNSATCYKSSSFPLYSYLLEQVKVVRYSEERDSSKISSSSGRNKPTGLAGLACIHCCGKGVVVGEFTNTNINTNKTTTTQQQQLHAEATIFPQDRRTLAKEIKTKLYHHVLSCEQSPPEIKETLRRLFWEQQQQHTLLGEGGEQNIYTYSNLEKKKTPSMAKSSKTTTTPIISKEERLFFKDLWYRM